MGPKRAAVTYSINIWTLRDGSKEFRLMHGNKIVSRHQTEAEAMAAWNARVQKVESAHE